MCIRDRSRINVQEQTFEGEKEQLVKVYNIIKDRMDLEKITQEIRRCQNVDPKIISIRERMLKEEETIIQYYKIHKNLLFIKNNPDIGEWKLVIPSTVEEQLILDYHIRYGHMGAMKVIKALEEQVYIKNIYRKVSKNVIFAKG